MCALVWGKQEQISCIFVHKSQKNYISKMVSREGLHHLAHQNMNLITTF